MSKKSQLWSDLAGKLSQVGEYYEGDDSLDVLKRLCRKRNIGCSDFTEIKNDEEAIKEDAPVIVNDEPVLETNDTVEVVEEDLTISTIELARDMFELKFGKPVPNNKKNDEEWINAAIKKED